MIGIQRAPKPAVLDVAVSRKTLCNKKEVVETLWEMQHKKCCYCEQHLPEEGHLKAVEHFRPKSVFKDLINRWENLLLSCPQCNGKKRERFPVFSNKSGKSEIVYVSEPTDETPAVIEPAAIDPEEHIDFDFSGIETDDAFGIIMEKNGSILGRTTIELRIPVGWEI